MSAQRGVPQYRQAYREATAVIASLADPRGPRFQTAAAGGVLNLRGYLASCETLYHRVFAALETLEQAHGSPPRILDAGGTFGALGLSLARMGVPVVSWERFGALGPRAERVIGALEGAGAGAVDGELAAQPPAEVAGAGSFQLVVGLALHRLAHAAVAVAAAAGELLARDGELFLGVASQDFWPTRLRRLRGKATRAVADDAVTLAEPVYGRAELQRLLRGGGLRPVDLSYANYTPRGLGAPAQQLLLDNVMRARPGWREAMLARAVREGG